MDKAIVKFNGGRGALLCNGCEVIVSYGTDHRTDIEHYCEKCYHKRNQYTIADIDYYEKDAIMRIGSHSIYFQFDGDEPTIDDFLKYIGILSTP